MRVYIKMDNIDKKILNIINKEFPVEERPYKKIARTLGITEEEVIRRVSVLKQKGIIRRIGGIIDPKAIGWYSILCAADIAPERIEEFARVVNSFVEVTHNYVRSGSPNCWFTIIAPSKTRASEIISEIKDRLSINIVELHARRIFKIDVGFNL
ncbi:MAG: AsnC family transcriptional regulator [Thermodesulfobacteriota bacterium]|nr:AsnC family transcriptional regulator [Thermodesulfobacteriota bacterium]